MFRSGSRSSQGLVFFALYVLIASTTQAQPATAQTSKDGVCDGDQEALVHYSLYWENFKNKNYTDALPDLRWMLENCPGFNRNNDRNFERAVEAYEGLAEAATSAEEKRMYLDSALVMFDRAVPTIQGTGGEIDEFQWTRDKGRFIQKHLEALDDRKGEAIEAYRKAYDLDPARLDPYYLEVIISDEYTSGDVGGALDFLRRLKETRGEEEGVQDIVRKYFSVIPPDEQINFLREELEKNPDNMEALTQLFELYEQEGYHEEMMELAPKMMQMKPTPPLLRMLTRLYIEDGEYEKAEATFKQMETMPGVEMKPLDYYNMGIAQLEMDRFVEARSYYQKALEVDPEFKQGLKAIADLYATAVARCGVPDRETKGVFWLVADAYQRAGDSAGAARYRAVFPNAEDIFYTQKWTEGSGTSVTYSCQGLTISGSTTVRKAS